MRKIFYQLVYGLISTLDVAKTTTLLNYGYVGKEKFPLPTSEEVNRTRIQLYYHVASGTSLKNKNILEVGCGRGGGARWVTKLLNPKKYFAIDLNAKEIQFCKHHFSNVKSLNFSVGDAERIPFTNEKFEVVLNVESSHVYPNVEIFFKEVYRVLKPKGYFLHADFRPAHKVSDWIKQLKSAGFEIEKKENITPKVLLALDKDSDHKMRIINTYVPLIFRPYIARFAGVKGSNVYRNFQENRWEYWNFVLRKK